MKNIIITGVVVIVLVFGFFWLALFIENHPALAPVIEEPATSTPATTDVATSTASTTSVKTYSTSDFSFSYPADFAFASSSSNSNFADGVSFIVPSSMTEGTNLGTDSRIYVETKATSTCSARSFVDPSMIAGSKSQSVTENGQDFDMVTTSDAGAGNFYKTDVYATEANKSCVGIELFVHSTNIANYDPGTIKAFDQSLLDNAIKTVLDSFRTN
jgi:hypothetical protein